MTKQSANLDHWSVMNVSFAKAHFKDKTITKMCNYLGKELGCLEQLYTSKGKCNAPGSSKWEVYCSIIKLLVTSSTEIHIKQAIYVIEYQVVIHEIFIARMMNKEYCITKANTMRVFEHQILDDLNYIAKYYCPFDRLYNDGFLAMVHPLYADCGLRLLSVIANSVTDDEILKHGNMTAKKAEAAVKNDKDLKATFLRLCEDTQELSEQRKTKLFYAITDKVLNSRLSTAIKRYKSMTTGRGSKLENGIAFRIDLKSISGKKSKQDAGDVDTTSRKKLQFLVEDE
jgi:hypothetical protein